MSTVSLFLWKLLLLLDRIKVSLRDEKFVPFENRLNIMVSLSKSVNEISPMNEEAFPQGYPPHPWSKRPIKTATIDLIRFSIKN
jgi:hypothetical protein